MQALRRVRFDNGIWRTMTTNDVTVVAPPAPSANRKGQQARRRAGAMGGIPTEGVLTKLDAHTRAVAIWRAIRASSR